MNSFLQGLLKAALATSSETSNAAIKNNASVKNTAISAGAGAALGALLFVLSRPSMQHPDVVAAVNPSIAGINPAA